MCLAVPGIIISKFNNLAEVDFGGITRKVALDLLPEAVEGDYILVHAGFAVKLISQEQALLTLELFREMALLTEDGLAEGGP